MCEANDVSIAFWNVSSCGFCKFAFCGVSMDEIVCRISHETPFVCSCVREPFVCLNGLLF